MNSELTKTDWIKSAAFRELIVIATIAVVAYVLAEAFELFEAIFGWAQTYEKWGVDGFIITSVVLVFAFGVFSFRRWKELKQEIAERQRVEEALEPLNEELEATIKKLSLSNRELQEFAYITAHDLKAPLRAIGTLVDWISEDYGDKFDEQGKERLELIVGRTERMSGLIDGILEYSRLAHADREMEEVDLNTLLKTLISEIAPLRENIEITIEHKLPTVICRRTCMTQVFQNLLSNAVKYMDKPEGQVKVGCVEENGFWKFSVADNGPGIEETYFKKIFRMFQTLSPRDKTESTGIGLSVVKKIVEMHSGRVWVESEVGKGSTFFFTLPRSRHTVENKASSSMSYR